MGRTTDFNKLAKKEKERDDLLADFKELVLKGKIQLKDIFDALNEKDCRRVAKKVKKARIPKSITESEPNKIFTPIPSGSVIDLSDDEQSRSEPFSDSGEENTIDVLNKGINESDLIEGVDKYNYSTNKSMVTKENQKLERRVDPFNDAGKILGKRKGNPPSRASISMREADPIDVLPTDLIDRMNLLSYDEKAKNRKASLSKQGLTKEKLEPKVAKVEDLEVREKLRLEKDRAEIDAWRRTQKVPEPNMINPLNGECSDIWREWFDRRLKQIENWLVEDASIYSHLPPSQECEPPRNFEVLAADWNVFRKSEIEVQWDYEKYGPIMLTENMAYDGTKLFDPLNGKTWNNIIEVLETEVKKKFEAAYPGAGTEVFERNDGFFWSLLIQQWYDNVNVSHRS